MLLLEPVSMIRYVTDTGLPVVDDSLCRESSEMISAAILSRSGYFHATEDAILLSDATEDLIRFYNVISQMKRYLRPGLTVPPSIKKIIEDSGHRYGMAVMSYGIKRSPVNKGLLITMDVLESLATDSSIDLTSKELFRSAVIIFDSQTDRVVYFHQLSRRRMDPMNKLRVQSCLNGLVSNYNWLY